MTRVMTSHSIGDALNMDPAYSLSTASTDSEDGPAEGPTNMGSPFPRIPGLRRVVPERNGGPTTCP